MDTPHYLRLYLDSVPVGHTRSPVKLWSISQILQEQRDLTQPYSQQLFALLRSMWAFLLKSNPKALDILWEGKSCWGYWSGNLFTRQIRCLFFTTETGLSTCSFPPYVLSPAHPNTCRSIPSPACQSRLD